MLLRPFVPFSRADERTELQAYMTASSDPDTYGELTAYVVQERTAGRAADRRPTRSTPSRRSPSRSPCRRAAATASASATCSSSRSPTGCCGCGRSTPPCPQGTDRDTTVTEYRFVIVVLRRPGGVRASRSARRSAKLFPGFEGDLGDRVGRPTSAGRATRTTAAETGEPTERHAGRAAGRRPTSCSPRPTRRSTTGDLGEYQAKVEEAKALIDQALDLMVPPAGG